MAWFYRVDGSFEFPAAGGPEKWRKTKVRSWRGKGSVKVAQVLSWSSKDTLVDDSAPSKFSSAFFLDLRDDQNTVHVRGYLHRDDVEALSAVFDEAAAMNAAGVVRFEHVLDDDSSIRFTLADGKVDTHVGTTDMPAKISKAVDAESRKRARQLM